MALHRASAAVSSTKLIWQLLSSLFLAVSVLQVSLTCLSATTSSVVAAAAATSTDSQQQNLDQDLRTNDMALPGMRIRAPWLGNQFERRSVFEPSSHIRRRRRDSEREMTRNTPCSELVARGEIILQHCTRGRIRTSASSKICTQGGEWMTCCERPCSALASTGFSLEQCAPGDLKNQDHARTCTQDCQWMTCCESPYVMRRGNHGLGAPMCHAVRTPNQGHAT
jgi:hypothetical protein